MSKNENRLNFRMTDETAAKIERWYREDNCRSKNEFIEKAVNCYADMLAVGESTTLPRAVQSAIDSRLKLFEDRIASLLYKQAVEMDMAKLLLEAIRTLPEEKRKAILLYYFEGMNDTEIAELFNTSRSTIQYRRTSSFERLRKYLEENADEWDEW